jgi:hypothetical protein
MKGVSYKVGLLLIVIIVSVPAVSDAVWFAAESVENYSGCGCGSSDNNLDYCNDQAEGFVDRMDDASAWSRDFWYANSNAWGRDFIEDEMSYGGQSGEDNFYADDRIRIMFVSGHGSLTGSGSNSCFSGKLCNAPGGSCTFNTGYMKLGERSGAYASPNPGSLRYMVMHMCYSVQYAVANAQWFRTVEYYVADYHMSLGMTGVCTDSWFLDEVGYDFADKAQHSSWTLKSAWWYAIEDWWHDDTGAVITWGNSQSNAVGRRDNEKFWSGSYKMFDDYGTASWWASAKHKG